MKDIEALPGFDILHDHSIIGGAAGVVPVPTRMHKVVVIDPNRPLQRPLATKSAMPTTTVAATIPPAAPGVLAPKNPRMPPAVMPASAAAFTFPIVRPLKAPVLPVLAQTNAPKRARLVGVKGSQVPPAVPPPDPKVHVAGWRVLPKPATVVAPGPPVVPGPAPNVVPPAQVGNLATPAMPVALQPAPAGNTSPTGANIDVLAAAAGTAGIGVMMPLEACCDDNTSFTAPGTLTLADTDDIIFSYFFLRR